MYKASGAALERGGSFLALAKTRMKEPRDRAIFAGSDTVIISLLLISLRLKDARRELDTRAM